ncbi:MAG: hypothetical protein GY859_14860, partial [Desulfobacterales bacterium]|nr:hypothetical protein [Desulfobacterales bacterium]
AAFKEFKNSFWEGTFRQLLEELPNTSSRVLITCRHPIPNAPPDVLRQGPLKELSEAEAMKLMFFSRDYGAVNFSQARQIYDTIGGNPKAIEDLGALLTEDWVTWEDLREKLEAVQKEMREFTLFETLYSFLNDAERSLFRKISVYKGPVGLEGLEIQAPDEDKLSEKLEKLVHYNLLQAYEDEMSGEPLHHGHPLNRGYIREGWWREGEKEAAHRNAAAHYLKRIKGLDLDLLIKAVHHL